MRQILILVCALLGATPTTAHEYQIGDLAIIHPHTPPTGPDGNLAHGYMELFNGGSETERLLAVRSGIADVSFFDRTVDDGNGARVADAIEIEPGQSVLLVPDARYIRFAELEEPLRLGDRFLATMIFEVAGQVTVEFWVEGTAEPSPAPASTAFSVPVSEGDAVAEIAALLQTKLGPETGITTISVAETAAVAGWTTQTDAGRAFLRRQGDEWRLLLLSGESLLSNAGLRAQGLSPRVANALLAEVRSNEADLPAATLNQINAFRGTLILSDK